MQIEVIARALIELERELNEYKKKTDNLIGFIIGELLSTGITNQKRLQDHLGGLEWNDKMKDAFSMSIPKPTVPVSSALLPGGSQSEREVYPSPEFRVYPEAQEKPHQ